MEKKQVRKDQAGKARIGAIGENLVVAKLMQQGWDAFNANCTIKNYKSIDVVCLNADMKESDELWWKPKTSLIQVKTSVQNNILLTGIVSDLDIESNIKDEHDKDNLELSAPACISISWLEGKPEFSSRNHANFGNPLSESCEDKWENIWED